MKERLDDAKRRMEGAVKNLGGEFASLRTGRASTKCRGGRRRTAWPGRWGPPWDWLRWCGDGTQVCCDCSCVVAASIHGFPMFGFFFVMPIRVIPAAFG